MNPAIMLFAQSPVAGLVQSRLAAVVGADSAAQLNRAFVADIVNTVRTLPGVYLELHVDAPTEEWMELGLPRRVQIPGDLGARLLHALESALEAGHSPAMVLGRDQPDLPPGHLTALLEGTHDVTLGPTESGRFYAISARRVHPDMFAGVQWGSSSTLAQIVASVTAAGLTVALGPAWFEADDAEGLKRLRASADLPPHTRAALEQLGGREQLTNSSD